MAKIIYGVYDEDSGEVYEVYPTAEACAGLPAVELVENFTGEPSDWTCPVTAVNYIAVDRLAEAFRELCKSTGMKKGALAKICGKNPNMFTRYCQGTTPVPKLIWEKVAEFKH